MTPEEHRDVLDGRLRVALGQFDEMLLEQQQALEEKQRQDPVQGGEDPGQAGGAGGSTGGMPGDGSGARPGSESGGQSPGSSRGAGGGPEEGDRAGVGAQDGVGDKRVPDDIGDGRDDDVVARQLREAAIKEKDPELRERLWDEYREYKKSAGS